MSKSVSITNLAAEIALAVEQYTEEVAAQIEAEVEATAKKVLADVKANSPIDTGAYKKGWRIKKKSGTGWTKYVVYQKTKPQIAHLLEFGHAKVGGGRVAARPHIRKTYDAHAPAMQRRIKRIIEEGGR